MQQIYIAQESENSLRFTLVLRKATNKCTLSINFPAQAEYSNFSAGFKLKIFLWIF